MAEHARSAGNRHRKCTSSRIGVCSSPIIEQMSSSILHTIVATCEKVAEESHKDYQELLVEHHALRQELEALEVPSHGPDAVLQP